MPTARARISFNTVYAEVQHERTDYEHPKGGKAKYLEGPLKQYAGLFEEFLAIRLKAAMARAGKFQSAASVARMLEGELEDAVGAFAEIILGVAALEAPIDEGILRGSGEVETGMVHAVG